MSIEHSKIGANIRNYIEPDKGSTNQRVGEWLQPSVAGYGLPTLELKAIRSASEISKRTSGKSNERVHTNHHEPNNEKRFLFGTAAAAALFLLMIFSYHLLIFEQSDFAIDSKSSIDIDKTRLNHSPESMLVNNKLSPEYIPGIEKEEEVASCALIVGSFARKSNAVEMQQKVIGAGYELYTEEFQNFYRVGVALDCSEIKGESFTNVENAIGIDPWLKISL